MRSPQTTAAPASELESEPPEVSGSKVVVSDDVEDVAVAEVAEVAEVVEVVELEGSAPAVVEAVEVSPEDAPEDSALSPVVLEESPPGVIAAGSEQPCRRSAQPAQRKKSMAG